MKKQPNSITKEVIAFLIERREMREAGFPYCYAENFIELHCDSCIEFYRKRKETHSECAINQSTN